MDEVVELVVLGQDAVPLSTQKYKCVPAKCQEKLEKYWGCGEGGGGNLVAKSVLQYYDSSPEYRLTF